jgi:hypothetical protein
MFYVYFLFCGKIEFTFKKYQVTSHKGCTHVKLSL